MNFNTTIDGGLVKVTSGTFILEHGATLTKGWAKSGGGVYILSTGTFIMNGGNISGNNVYNSGGVHNRGMFSMIYGNISGNTAPNGGGVRSGGAFTMGGGNISDNIATSIGGGVYVPSTGTFEMNGGNISGNSATQGGGVYNAGTFTMAGGANITADNDVYLYTGGKNITIGATGMKPGKGAFNITPSSSFTEGAIVVDGTAAPGGASTANFLLNATYAAETNYILGKKDGNLILSPPYPAVTYDAANGNSWTEQLTSNTYPDTVPSPEPVKDGCRLLGWNYYNGTQVYNTTHRLVENVLQDTSHNLTALWYKNTSVTGWGFTEKLTITYAAANNLTSVPVADSIRFGSGTQNITFTITGTSTAGRVVCTDSGGTAHAITLHDNNQIVTINDGDPAGLYTLTYTGSYKGDTNLDGVVDIVDASGLGLYTIKGDSFTLTPEQKLHGDIDMDGQITVADILAIHAHIVGQ